MKDDPQLLSFLDSTPGSTLYQFMPPVDKLKLMLSNFLTPNESKILIFLGKYGPQTAIQATKSLRVPRTETYRLLTNLQNMGIVSATFDHPTRFSSLEIDHAVDILVKSEFERVRMLQSQKKEIVELWNSIPSFVKDDEMKLGEKFQILKGHNRIIPKINEMISEAKQSLLLLGSERHFMKLYHADSLDLLQDSKARVRILTSCSTRSIPIFERISTAEVKKLHHHIQSSLCFMVRDQTELISFIKNDLPAQDMMAIRTNSEALIYAMTLLFNNMWSISPDLSEGKSSPLSYSSVSDRLCAQ